MKQAQLPNPSRSEVLSWINTHVEGFLGSVRRIEDLGNGAAYLYIIAQLRPNSVKPEKIIKHPFSHSQVLQNLKLLATIFEKLGFKYSIQLEKLAEMKYQQNFYLACFLFRTLGMNPEFTARPSQAINENMNAANKIKKLKIIPPQKKIIPNYTKDPPPEFTIEDLNAIQGPQRKLKEIETIFLQDQSSRIKLQKIAAILNLQVKRTQIQQTATMTQEQSTGNISIEASYKRFLRPSLCERSTFLNNNRIPLSFEKTARNDHKKTTENMIIPMSEILPSTQFEGEMLLSQRKDEKGVENEGEVGAKDEEQTRVQVGQFKAKEEDVVEGGVEGGVGV